MSVTLPRSLNQKLKTGSVGRGHSERRGELRSLRTCESNVLNECGREGLTVLLLLGHVLLCHIDISLSGVEALDSALVVMGT